MSSSALIVAGEFLLLASLIGFAAWEVWKLRRERRQEEEKARRDREGER